MGSVVKKKDAGKTTRGRTAPAATSPLIDRHEVAALAGVKVQTLNNWIADPKHPFPKGSPLGNGPRSPRRWFRDDVLEYVRDRREGKRSVA